MSKETLISVQTIRRQEAEKARGLVVVIDVLQAFTTTAYAFAAGAKEIFLVSTIEEAFALKTLYPDMLLAGERNGLPIEGFDLKNSPREVENYPFAGRLVAMRSSSGTQGVVLARNAHHLLVASFVVANATLRRIREIAPKEVTLMVTGTTNGGLEDFALADYLTAALLGQEPDSQPHLQQVIDSPLGQAHIFNDPPHFTPSDLEAALDLDRFSFAMEVEHVAGQLILKAVNPDSN